MTSVKAPDLVYARIKGGDEIRMADTFDKRQQVKYH